MSAYNSYISSAYDYFSDSWRSMSDYLVPGGSAPHSVRVEVDVDVVQRDSHTERFQLDDFLVVRRDEAFSVQLVARSRLEVSTASLVYEEGKDEVSLQVVELDSRRYGSILKVRALYL